MCILASSFELCLKSFRNKHVAFYVHESEIEKSDIQATDATTSLLGFDIIVYAKVGDVLDWERYPALFFSAIAACTLKI